MRSPRSKPQPYIRNPTETHPVPRADRRDVIADEGLTLDEGVTWLIADEAGLDGRALALAGHAAQPVLRLMRAAAHAKTAAKRTALTERAENALRKLSPAKMDEDAYAALVDQVTARIAELALPDSDGDSPTATPSINPETGLQEFARQPIWPPPRPGHKPDPNMSDAKRARLNKDAAKLRARIGRDQLGDINPFPIPTNTNFQDAGYELAGDSLNHFLAGSGQERHLDPSTLRGTRTIRDAEDQNRGLYVTDTFGDWQPYTKKGIAEKAKLDAIEDGETISLEDRWKKDFSGEWAGIKNTVLGSEPDKELAVSIGTGKLISDGRFDVTRRGNTLYVSGNVEHGIDDVYDFDRPTIPGLPDDQSAAYRLQNSGYAQPFINRSKWTQPMNAVAEILHDGKRRVKHIEWGEITPALWPQPST